MPSRLDHAPSCMCPPPARVSSSACCATTAPGSDAAYSSARRITPALATQEPSSVKMRTPSAYSSPIGASCSPARPTVMQPDDTTSHSPAAAPVASTELTTAASSSAGRVLGMATTAVNPPRAAARVPVSMVSASSSPGSRRCTCRSTSPGLTTHPEASKHVSSSPATRSGATSTTFPSRTRTSARRRVPASSITSPPVIRISGNASHRVPSSE